MEEIWKTIEEFPNYEVSNMGRVYSKKSNTYLKPMEHRDGYLKVGLYIDNNRCYKFIHRLVAQAFIPNDDNLPEVNHINKDKHNNCVENLEWSSRTHNIQHSHGKIVQQYDTDGNLINEFPSCGDAGITLGVPYGSIWYAIQKSKNHIYNGYFWKYKNS